MNKIFRTEFGSTIYGTRLPTSDTDYKSIFIPSYRDIILQRAPRNAQESTKELKTARNSADDVEEESISLQEYCRLLAEGQTLALDMLFSPPKHHNIWSPTWRRIVENKDKFLHQGTSSFIGYTKQQAAKYGVKGFRISAIEQTLNFLTIAGADYHKLNKHENELRTFVQEQNSEFIKITDCKGPNGSFEPHLDVCNRKVPFHATVKYAHSIFQKIYDNYGARAQLAKDNQGIDWKALMHAVRVAREAEELLLTGHITLPRPEKDLLLKIRKGELDYEKTVAPLIEEGLTRIEEAKRKSTLPLVPDFEWIDNFIFDVYSNNR